MSASEPANSRPTPDYLAPAMRALLNAAVDLFYHRGYDATSVREIVEAANLTKGAFYHYFTSKDDVLFLIHDEYLDRQLAALEVTLNSPGDARSKLDQVIHQIVGGLESDYKTMAVFMHERRALSPQSFRRLKRKRQRYETGLMRLIDEGVATGQFRPIGDSKLIAFAIIGMSSWGAEWFSPRGPLSAAEIADLYGDFVLGGLEA